MTRFYTQISRDRKTRGITGQPARLEHAGEHAIYISGTFLSAKDASDVHTAFTACTGLRGADWKQMKQSGRGMIFPFSEAEPDRIALGMNVFDHYIINIAAYGRSRESADRILEEFLEKSRMDEADVNEKYLREIQKFTEGIGKSMLDVAISGGGLIE